MLVRINNIHLAQNVLLFCIPIQYPLGEMNLPISIPTKSAQTCPNHWFCPGIKFAVSVSSTKTVAFADVVTASDTVATVLLISDDEKEVLTVTGIGNFIFLSFPLPHKFGPKFLIDSGLLVNVLKMVECKWNRIGQLHWNEISPYSFAGLPYHKDKSRDLLDTHLLDNNNFHLCYIR